MKKKGKSITNYRKLAHFSSIQRRDVFDLFLFDNKSEMQPDLAQLIRCATSNHSNYACISNHETSYIARIDVSKPIQCNMIGSRIQIKISIMQRVWKIAHVLARVLIESLVIGVEFKHVTIDSLQMFQCELCSSAINNWESGVMQMARQMGMSFDIRTSKKVICICKI